MIVNLPETLEQSTFHTSDPFVIFEIDNFLNDSFYTDLTQDVAKRQEFDRVFSNRGQKRKFSVGAHNVADLSDGPLKTFCTYFLSQDFFDWFVRTHLPHFNSDTIPVQVPEKGPELKKLKRQNAEAGIAASYYCVEIHYSSIEHQGFIPPHTDAPKKRLSLVYYTPQSELPQDMAESLGTSFYKVRKNGTPWEQFNSGLLNPKDTERFLSDYEVAHKSVFAKNRCVGFIKNDISWHAVTPNQFEYDRRAIVINIVEV